MKSLFRMAALGSLGCCSLFNRHIYSLNSIPIHLWYDLLFEGVPEDGDGNLLETKVVLNTGKENVDSVGEWEKIWEKRAQRKGQRASKGEKNKGRVLFSYSVSHTVARESCKNIFSKFRFTTMSTICFFLLDAIFIISIIKQTGFAVMYFFLWLLQAFLKLFNDGPWCFFMKCNRFRNKSIRFPSIKE